jgi:hypothetical protein
MQQKWEAREFLFRNAFSMAGGAVAESLNAFFLCLGSGRVTNEFRRSFCFRGSPMSQQPPPPLCKAFLVCHRIINDTETGEAVLVGQPTAHQHHNYPTAQMMGFFARLASAHGDYLVEIQLQSGDGTVLWRDGPPDNLPMPEPLMLYDLKFNLNVVLPAPGEFEFVLTLNGNDVARQPFRALLTPVAVK